MRPSANTDEPPVATAPARGGSGSTGFGTTLFENLTPLHAPQAAGLGVFDACHVGVVLRALLFVQMILGVGVLFDNTSWASWSSAFASGSVASLTAVLLWLLIACTGKRLFGRLSMPGQWAVAIALGAGCGVAGATLAWLISGLATAGAVWCAHALAGAGLAAALFQWLRLRAQAAMPAQTAARLSELQSRIRPHFLFNTLNTALALVRHDPAAAEGVLEDLSELFRVAISDTAQSVTLGEEVELAQRYLAIEQIRFGTRLQVSWELDPQASQARVPPLLLQPLVENAVRHGVEPSDRGGQIRVRTRVKLGRALISIVNTVPSQPSHPGHGVALRNVRERLRLMHDVAAQFDARREDGLFRVQIVVPL
jgi:two-component system sensor histidine kinase AlgZ